MQALPRDKKLISILKKAAENIYAVPRLGIVVSDSDPIGEYRFLVQIPSLGWNTNNKAVWCYVSDKKAYISPKIGDYVIIQFMDGKIDNAFISGCANHMKDMISNLYNNNIDVIYEMPNIVSIIYDKQANEIKIGNKDFRYAARINDAVESTAIEDATYWAWLSGLIAVFLTWVPVPGDGGAALKLAMAAYILANPVPSSLTGKITAASDQVKIGKK